MAAVEDLLPEGPVEIIKRNRPACIVVSIRLYRELTAKRRAGARHTVSDLFALPARGRRSRKELDAEIQRERAGWGDR
ncbi:MAG TPA: type II toxin-antitoxin system Phd/YefM family antitoxin [bacterium]